MTTIIYYSGGAYGTFIEWLLTYLTDQNLSDELPFGRKGNSHQFKGNFIVNEIVETPTFARTHPDYFSIDSLLLRFDKIIDITFKDSSKFWIWNNINSKVKLSDLALIEKDYFKKYEPNWYNLIQLNDEDQFRYYLENITDDTACLEKFGVNKASDLTRWQLRELLSYWNFAEFQPNYFNFQPHYGENIYNLSIESLRDNLPRAITKLVDYLKLSVIPDRVLRLKEIWEQWLDKQTEIDSDKIIDSYIDTFLSKKDFIAPRDFNIYEEAWIQQKLRIQGYEIQCDGLNQLPRSSLKLRNDYSTYTERT